MDPLAPTLPGIAASLGIRSAAAGEWLSAIRNAGGFPSDELAWVELRGGLGDAAAPLDSHEAAALLAGCFPSLSLSVNEGDALQYPGYVPPGSVGVREFLVELHGDPGGEPWFRSNDWSDRPVLMHLRTRDVPGPGGTTLEVIECQSEWHQKGARHGYSEDPERARQAAARAWTANEERIAYELSEGCGKEFVRLLAAAGAHPASARRTAFSFLAGVEMPASVSRQADAAWDTLAPLREMFAARKGLAFSLEAASKSVRQAPYPKHWPKMGMRLALAAAACLCDTHGNPYVAVGVAAGDQVAGMLEADETVTAVEWSTSPDGNLQVAFETCDANGTRIWRPTETLPPDDIAARLDGSDVAADIARRIVASPAGTLDPDWILEQEPVTWRNLGLRRLYDTHLPRILAAEAKRAGMGVSGKLAIHYGASRACWTLPDAAGPDVPSAGPG